MAGSSVARSASTVRIEFFAHDNRHPLRLLAHHAEEKRTCLFGIEVFGRRALRQRSLRAHRGLARKLGDHAGDLGHLAHNRRCNEAPGRNRLKARRGCARRANRTVRPWKRRRSSADP